MSFDYDGFGRRVRRTAPNGAVTQYLYRGDDLLLEMDGSGNLRREYTYYPGIDRPHSVREHTSGVAGRYYFTMELPGHVSGLLNASGQMVNEYRYSPFGKPLLVQEGVPNPLRYMAREWDADAGLYYVRNRWYDPDVGRFVSEDPIGLAGGINVYAYAWNDPNSHRDPLGLTPDGCEVILRALGASAEFIRRACSHFGLDPVTVVATPGENPFAWYDEWFNNAQQEVLGPPRGGDRAAPGSGPASPNVAERTRAENCTAQNYVFEGIKAFTVASTGYVLLAGGRGAIRGGVAGGAVGGLVGGIVGGPPGAVAGTITGGARGALGGFASESLRSLPKAFGFGAMAGVLAVGRQVVTCKVDALWQFTN